MNYRERLRKDPLVPQRYITMGEAMDNIDDRVNEVVILPPVSGDQEVATDEEDDPPEGIIGEPAGEIETFNSDSNDENDIETDHRWSRNVTRMSTMDDNVPITELEYDYPLLVDKSPFCLWKEVFDNDMLLLIKEQTILYARRDKGDQNFQLDEEELLKFLGIVLLSGYHWVPSESDYWSNQIDLHVDLVASTMSRNAFQTIKKYLHLADNRNLISGDKAAKVNPLYDLLNISLERLGIFHKYLSIDESMVPYRGRHSMRMFIKSKPIRFGYKLWVLAGQDGYPYKFEIYQGRSSDGQNQSEPLGTRVVNKMLETVKRKSLPENHLVFMDNFFTSYRLLSDLKKENFKATGTLRQNRSNGACKLMKNDKSLKQEGRGAFDFRTDGDVYVVKWQDNATAVCASNHLTHEPIQTTKRRSRRETVNVPQPYLIKKYNQGKRDTYTFE